MPSSTTATAANVGAPAAAPPTSRCTVSVLDERMSAGTSIFTAWVSSVGRTRTDATPNARSGRKASLDSTCGSLTRKALMYRLGANAAGLKLQATSPAATSFHSLLTTRSVSTVNSILPR